MSRMPQTLCDVESAWLGTALTNRNRGDRRPTGCHSSRPSRRFTSSSDRQLSQPYHSLRSWRPAGQALARQQRGRKSRTYCGLPLALEAIIQSAAPACPFNGRPRRAQADWAACTLFAWPTTAHRRASMILSRIVCFNSTSMPASSRKLIEAPLERWLGKRLVARSVSSQTGPSCRPLTPMPKASCSGTPEHSRRRLRCAPLGWEWLPVRSDFLATTLYRNWDFLQNDSEELGRSRSEVHLT